MGGCEEGSELRSEPLIDCLCCVVGVIGLAMDHAADAHRTDLMTITRHVLNEQSKHPESRGDFSILLSHIVLGCKFVCSAVNKVSLPLWVFFFFGQILLWLVWVFMEFDLLAILFCVCINWLCIGWRHEERSLGFDMKFVLLLILSVGKILSFFG